MSDTTVQPMVVRAGAASTREMRWGRGVQHRYVGPEHGAQRLDVHLNVINAGSGVGPYHYHEHAENVYVVLQGSAEAIVDGRRYICAKETWPSFLRESGMLRGAWVMAPAMC